MSAGHEKGTGKNDYVDRFIKVFGNLPLEEREQFVVVIDNQPITWTMAYNHVRNKTALGDKIGKKLIELDII